MVLSILEIWISKSAENVDIFFLMASLPPGPWVVPEWTDTLLISGNNLIAGVPSIWLTRHQCNYKEVPPSPVYQAGHVTAV